MLTLLFVIPFVLIVVINAVIGLVRGLNKSVIRLMFLAVSAILTFLLAGPVTQLIAGSISIGGQSLGEMLLASVEGNATLHEIIQEVPLLRELLLSVPAFVLSLVVFPLVFGVFGLLTWIAYLFAQKPLRKLIFKDKRTKEEEAARPEKERIINRLSGLGVGVLTGLIIFGMMVTPLCGLAGMLPDSGSVNRLTDSIVAEGQMSDSDADMVKEVYGAANNGLLNFYGFFGAKLTGKAYLDAVTTVEADGVRTSLGAELSNVVAIAQTMVDSGVLLGVTDENGQLDVTKIDFDKLGAAVTMLQHSSLKPVGTALLDMLAQNSNSLFANAISTVRIGYENDEDIAGTISAAGALINLGTSIKEGASAEEMADSMTALVENLNEFTIELLPDIINEETVTSIGIPGEYADATCDVMETMLGELMELKGSENYDNEVNAIVSLYNIATTEVEEFNQQTVEELYAYASDSDAIFNTLVSVSTSNPFGIEINNDQIRQDLTNAIEETYDLSAKTDRDQSIANAIATLLGIETELELG